MKAPYIAELVHYVDDNSDDELYCVAAIIVAIPASYREFRVDLNCITFDDKLEPHGKIHYSDKSQWGSWHRPDECPISKEKTTQ